MNPEPRTLSPELIVALDVDSLKMAEKLVGLLYPKVKIFKIGSQLFTLYGPSAVEMVRKKGAKVFLDLKFHDIPNTVANAVTAAARLKVFMLTLHTQGGLEMMQKAKAAADKEAARLGIKPPLIAGVTVLTSQAKKSKIGNLVISLTDSAISAGLDAVVASVKEAGIIRGKFGRKILLVTPGIRPKNATVGDQRRIGTSEQAARAGADYIVVGRPIIEAKNPLSAVEEILKETRLYGRRY